MRLNHLLTTTALLLLAMFMVCTASAQAQSILTAADLRRWNNETNIANLAKVMMSEASIGNTTERQIVGFSVLNRMKRNSTNAVTGVWSAYAHNQTPTSAIKTLARQMLAGQVDDPSNGATHFYSPRSMPMEGQRRVGDTGGGLERVLPLARRNYKPSWAAARNFQYLPFFGVREHYYKFYRAAGAGRVA